MEVTSSLLDKGKSHNGDLSDVLPQPKRFFISSIGNATQLGIKKEKENEKRKKEEKRGWRSPRSDNTHSSVTFKNI
ncbi:metabolite/drug transporter, putative [Plasmodium ovale curtisi]|uniref:Metabolite/drug transporter, putative n=1 Tax=Plasmodium ovale curtisi TaxID=864141 RepID=A0A1A8WLJ9_PLAOA|nr:metabolite/drug transporter, putative [Plasmodium ovale curtisi]SBS92731.1 metabolite/drug transporter, putative [Plasmodium ovale curtisi]